jgi:hypothetical protein
MAKSNPNIPYIDIEEQDPVTGYISQGTSENATIPTTAGLFALGCLIQDTTTGIWYQNTGTVAVPVWTAVGAGKNATTGISGGFNIGTVSTAQVLNTNPGATVVGQAINILHSAGAGNCDDLVGQYVKVAISGAGDSGTTLAASAPRVSVSATVAKEAYASQPWATHTGTGTVTAMSALSAALRINDAEAFTATNSINAGHFHVLTPGGAANGTVTSNNFDGVMIEVYPNVTGLRSALNVANETSAGVTDVFHVSGATYFTNLFEFDAAAGCVGYSNSGNDGFVSNNKGTLTLVGFAKIKVGANTYYMPYGTVA